MVEDPISDFIIRLKNASRVRHDRVGVPYSRLKHNIADLLAKEGYIKGATKKGKKIKKTLEVELLYDQAGAPRLTDAKRFSKPSRRIYRKAHELSSLGRGTGVVIVSTPKGVMTADQAHKQNMGGEVLFEVV